MEKSSKLPKITQLASDSEDTPSDVWFLSPRCQLSRSVASGQLEAWFQGQVLEMARVVRPWATWVSGRRKLMVNSGKDETLGSTCYALRILPYMGKHWQGWRVLRRGL